MLLVVPQADEEPWPTLGAGVCSLLEETAVYGPGSLEGQPYVIDPEFRAFLYRAYEIYPKGHPFAGRRRFRRVGLSVRKGLAKTEKEALIVYAELHPEAPVRFDGWDAHGDPVGRPVRRPYIPMLAVTVEQVEDLAFGALQYICREGADAELFDVTDERVASLDDYGRVAGEAIPLANAPGARDGARTTLNAFDEPHRLYLPRQRAAHTTMSANLPKRPLEDPWSLYVGTAGQPGQNSIAEDLHKEALRIRDGKVPAEDQRLFYLYRTDDDPKRDLTRKAERIRAIDEATGPAGEWGPGQFDDIASQWDVEGADPGYLERVWLNRWVRSKSQFFDLSKFEHLKAPDERIPAGAFITLGFDGARFRDATALVGVDIATGLAELLGLWEKDEAVEDWEVPEAEVTDLVAAAMSRYNVWRLYADPPHWTETVGSWAARWPDRVEEWWTARPKMMAYAHRELLEGIDSQSLRIGGPVGAEGEVFRPHLDLLRHVGNAGAKELRLKDDEGKPLYVMQKPDGRPEVKFDAAMALSLAWKARGDAIKSGAKPTTRSASVPRRIR